MVQPGSPPPVKGRDWTAEAADRIEAAVIAVRNKTTVPAQKVGAAIVYGVVIAFVGVAVLILLLIGLFRLHVFLPYHPEGRRVWTSYLALGAIFTASGWFLWRKRTAQPKG